MGFTYFVDSPPWSVLMHCTLGIYLFTKMMLLLLLSPPVSLQIEARKDLCPYFALINDVIYSHSPSQSNLGQVLLLLQAPLLSPGPEASTTLSGV